MKSSCLHGRRIAFSLIELLITVAVIAILLGMLLPALNSAREKAATILCVSNIKQLGVFSNMYSSDNDDYVVIAQGNNGDNLLSGSWFPYLWRYHRPADPTLNDSEIKKLALKKTVFNCPSYKPSSSSVYIVFGYGFNLNFHMEKPSANGADPGMIYKKTGFFKQPGKTMLLCDSQEGYKISKSSIAKVINAATCTKAMGSGLESYIGLNIRHMGGNVLNTGFLDGHAASLGGSRINLKSYSGWFWAGVYDSAVGDL